MQPQQPQAPYQPQQSPMQPMQPAPKQKKKPTASGILLIAMVVTGVVLVVSLLSWLILSFQTSSDTGDTLAGAAAVIEPESIAPVSASVESTLGVTVPFNARELSAFGSRGGHTLPNAARYQLRYTPIYLIFYFVSPVNFGITIRCSHENVLNSG